MSPITHALAAPATPADRHAPDPYRIVSRLPVHPTPAGAFRAVARPQPDAVARLLQAILREPRSPTLDEEAVCRWAGTANLDAALTVLHSAQEDGLVEGLRSPLVLPQGPLDELVPPLLETLSDQGEVLLSDAEGLPLWSHGIEDDFAVRLAALSGDIASLNERHAATLSAAVGDDGGAWALVDGVGASRVGCWPLHIGRTRFVLVARGLPRMHHPNFTQLVWLLVHRYG